MTIPYPLETLQQKAQATIAINNAPKGAYMILVTPNDPEKLRLVVPVQPVDYERAAA